MIHAGLMRTAPGRARMPQTIATSALWPCGEACYPHSPIAVNAAADHVYVALAGANSLTTIDGGANTVIATTPVGLTPVAVDVNPTNNRIYVANHGDDSVSTLLD
jgi:YVTN family beta-propeller protein